MSDRKSRIDAAKLKIQGLNLVIDPLKKQLSEAEHELRCALAEIEIGDRVECGSWGGNHGREYDAICKGKVVALPTSLNKHYVVEDAGGKRHEVFRCDMERT